jgi:hypothetical protein
LLVVACNAQGGPSAVVTGATNPAGASSTSAAVAAKTTPRVYLAEGQDVRGRLLYRPACKSGCPLSGDSTAILDTMTWPTWSASKAVGTGTYEAGRLQPGLRRRAGLQGARGGDAEQAGQAVFLRRDPLGLEQGSFRFPHGLPKALRGSNAPLNPWVFSLGELRRPAQLR